MIPPARFKAGDFVKSKKEELLKVIKSWPVNEVFGLMAGTFKFYKYLVENDSGRSFILRESALSDPEANKVNESLPAESASALKPPISKDNSLDFDPNDDWNLSQILQDFDGYERYQKSKPLPCLGKRKCFSFSPVKSSALMASSSIVSTAASSSKRLFSSEVPVADVSIPVSSPRNTTAVLVAEDSFSAFPKTVTSTPIKSSPAALFTLSPPQETSPAASFTLSPPQEISVPSKAIDPSALGSIPDKGSGQPSVGRNIAPDLLLTESPPIVPAEEVKTFLTSEEITKITSKNKIEPKDSRRKSDRIFDIFQIYIKQRGVETDIAEITPKNLSHMLSSFWAERTRGDGKLHDVTTLHSEFSRLAAILTKLTKNNPTTHPEFSEYRKTKEAKLAQSKQQLGNGQLSEQRDALDVEEISHFYQIGLINYGSGPGIVREFFITFMLVLNFRAIKDHLILKLGNLKVVRNEKGLIEYACYVSQWTKTDDGVTGRGISKRGVVVPSSDRRTCFFTYLDVYMRMREMCGQEFLLPESPFYLQPRLDGVDYEGSNNRCMFLPKPISECFLTNIVKNMVIAAEIDEGDRKISNTSLRVASFHGQENLSIDAQTGQSISGHIAEATCATYRRKNQERQQNIGAGLMATFTGTPAVIPLTYGQKFKLKMNRQLTIVDTSSTIVDCTPQLLSMQYNNQSSSVNPRDKYPSIPKLQPTLLKLPSVLRQPPQPATDEAEADGVSTRQAPQEKIPSAADGVSTQLENDAIEWQQSFVVDVTDPSDNTISSELRNMNLAPSTGKVVEKSSNTQDLKIGTLVFCKLRGHKDPHWPGVITYVLESGYNVLFYGTNQTAFIPRSSAEDGFLVQLSSDALSKYSNPRNLKPNKKKLFCDAFAIIVKESGQIAVPSLLTNLPLQSKENVMNLPNKKSFKKLSLRGKRKKGKENMNDEDLADFDI